jgi:hypothetical protein
MVYVYEKLSKLCMQIKEGLNSQNYKVWLFKFHILIHNTKLSMKFRISLSQFEGKKTRLKWIFD